MVWPETLSRTPWLINKSAGGPPLHLPSVKKQADEQPTEPEEQCITVQQADVEFGGNSENHHALLYAVDVISGGLQLHLEFLLDTLQLRFHSAELRLHSVEVCLDIIKTFGKVMLCTINCRHEIGFDWICSWIYPETSVQQYTWGHVSRS